jgi:hypothetical protein
VRRIPLAVFVLLAALTPAVARAADSDSTSAVAELRREAHALEPLARSKLVHRFLAATAQLPSIAPRTVFYDSSRTHYWNAREAAALPESIRTRAISRVLDESFYYNTRYGSPLAYTRPLELLAAAGFGDVAGRRIADFGYGTIGHLRLLASLGADMHGIDVDPLLAALYSEPGDLSAIAATQGHAGSLAIHTGHFPTEDAITHAVGDHYDLFLSKNTLKNGYLHPAEAVNPRMLVHLGVGDTAFVQRLAAVVKPGGLLLIYNLCPAPAPAGKPYIPWADGRCPFPRALLEAAGFDVLAFDRDDSPAARTMGHALGWDAGESPMDLEHDLFATYTLCRRARR